ncbi:hypothetical protein F5B20DRAFT_536267 [Whalleya microplaca]|nr:hypothetical protein F5B20DRAFT_536267 [Whalleya microplaca]
MSGSGKTHFCCKFAEDNRNRFWGVFWVDGSSVEMIEKGLVDIARLAGRDPNPNAALHWISTSKRRWLLLIDNADNADITLEDYFPKGEGGHILVTTINPGFKILGNIEPRYYNFSGLQFDEASRFLLKASDLPTPWESSWENLASNITKALGFLALAIISAGTAIRNRLCSLQTYLDWHERIGARMRKHKRTGSATKFEHVVWASFEICYQHLEGRRDQLEASDAIEMLHIFAFLYREDISRDIFIKALKNAQVEAEQQGKDMLDELSQPDRRPTLKEWLQPRIASLATMVLGGNAPAPLPSIIRDGREVKKLELSEDRIRLALNELVQMSLISYNETNDTYNMHPVVHAWARQRPRISLAEQALWADMAAQVLSASILLPPLGSTASDELYHAQLLTHVDHVQTCRETIATQLAEGTRSIWVPWLRVGSRINADRLRMHARFSLVYIQCGHFEKAEPLLGSIVDFLHRYLGPEHKRTRVATEHLSVEYWELGRPAEALKMRQDVANTCEMHLGRGHPDTMVAWNKLGKTLWQQGKFTEAKKWQLEAVNGLTKCLGRKHPRTLEAIDDLGRTIGKFWRESDLNEAFKLFSEAVDGMEEVLGPQNLTTTFAKENLARMSALLGEPYIERALQHMDEVIETRKERMGKEAGWTLMGMAHKAVVLCALGQTEEAERIMRSIIPIAKRNFEADHIGILFGRQVLATILN